MIRPGLLAALLMALLALLPACADGDDSSIEPDPTAAPTTPATTEAASPSPDAAADERPVIEVRDGQVQGGAPTIEAGVDETVSFRVIADVADVVHVHGFDHHFDVLPGQETVVVFTAEFAGQFEVELEEAGLLIAELEIR